MIIWVRVETMEKYEAGHGDFKLKRLFETLSGEPCLVMHMSEISPELVASLNPRALLLSGCGTWFKRFSPADFYRFEDTVNALADVPTLAFCGSHQLLGFMFNQGFRNMTVVEDEVMRPLRPGEPAPPEPGPDTVGYFCELGYYPLTMLKPDPLFEGLPNPFVVRESHYCEIKTLPPEFELLASNENCRIQAMKHKNRILYGTQFHPEAYVDVYPHGRVVLENFFRIAGIAKDSRH
jgi:anthranilate/para-aminobenzoate synthase component II